MLIASIGALGGLAAATGLSWATMDATSQLYGRTFIGSRRAGRKLALTFDDGPNDPYTGHLLDALAKHGVRATFFMLGEYVRQRPAMARAVAEAGHDIGNHTWSHPNLIWCSTTQARDEIRRTAKMIEDAVGPHTNFFRPPYGGRRPASLRVVKELGMAPVMWSVSARDWVLPSAEAIEQQVWTRLRGGDVVLMHDGSHRGMGWDRGKTVAAADRLIQRAKSEGWQLATVSELMTG